MLDLIHMLPPARSPLDHVISALKWIKENRTDSDGKKPSMRRIVMRAGLNPSHADSIVQRRQASIEPTTVARLAKSWNVSYRWMMTGQPPAEPFDPTELPDPYPKRADALQFAAAAGNYPKQAMKLVADYRLPAGEPDPGAKFWLDLLDFGAKHGRLPERETTSTDAMVTLVRPKEWPGWQKVSDSILSELGLELYWEAVIGWGEIPTTMPCPTPLTRGAILPHLDRFLEDHPQGKRGDMWDQWHRAAHIRHEQLRSKHPATKRNPTSMKIQKASSSTPPPGKK